MESSTAILFRVLVMLTCLVMVPMAAMFGSAFPELVRSALLDRFIASAAETPAAVEPGLGEAPSFDTAPVGSWDRPMPWEQGPALVDLADTSAPAPLGHSAAEPRGFAPGWPDSRAETVVLEQAETADSRAVISADYEVAADLSGGDMHPQSAGEVRAGNAITAGRADAFSKQELLLRRLGATHYRLETWGNQYRFECRMAVGPGSDLARHFEATAGDPLVAMQSVVAQIDVWRHGTGRPSR